MKFYKNIIAELEEPTKITRYHYHEWSPRSIEFYYDICTNNPFIWKQFYPIEYWEDFLAWAASKITTKPRTVVDIGCGNGNLVECARRIHKNASIYGVDLSEESLRSARARFKQYKNIQFRVGTFEHLPFEDSSVDLVTCTEVLEHVFPETFNNSFSEVSRILKKGGYYLASVSLGEKINFVCCPECGSVFTPYQDMMLEITRDDILQFTSKHGLELISFYQALDRSQPNNRIKKVLKPLIIDWLPNLAKRLFPKAGVSGFLAHRSN